MRERGNIASAAIFCVNAYLEHEDDKIMHTRGAKVRIRTEKKEKKLSHKMLLDRDCRLKSCMNFTGCKNKIIYILE